MGDEERGEPEGGCGDRDDAVAGETLGEEAESDGDPSDEKTRGVEIGDRGTSYQRDAPDETGGGEEKGEDGDAPRGNAERGGREETAPARNAAR